jgi:hypothetical protein
MVHKDPPPIAVIKETKISLTARSRRTTKHVAPPVSLGLLLVAVIGLSSPGDGGVEIANG